MATRSPPRVGRKPRRPLEREAVVSAAFTVLDRHGLDGLTIRALADELGVKNPALYWHFQNKQEIVDLMAERLIAESVVERAPDEPWVDWLRRAAVAFRRSLRSRRDGPRIVASADLSTSAMAQRLETGLTAMAQAGLTPVDALLGLLAVFDFTLGATFESDADPRPAGARSFATRPRATPRPQFPALEAALAAAASQELDEEATFLAGVELLLSGLALRVARPQR